MKFSIVLPTYNRAHVLPQTLERLSDLDYPSNQYEIVIVDNNSTDDTAKIVKKLQKKITNIRYVFEKKQGRTFASIKGINVAKHKKIVFIDDDIHVKKNFLQLYQKAYQANPTAAIIGGPILAKWPKGSEPRSFLSKVLAHHEPWIFGEIDYGKKRRKLRYPNALFAGNMSINLATFHQEDTIFSNLLGRKAGGKYLYAEDYELCLRMELLRREVIYEPTLLVENAVEVERTTNGYLLKRLLNSGVERYLIDQLLQDFPAHISLQPRLTSFVLNLLKTRTSAAFWELIIRIPVAIGYVFQGKITAQELKNSV